MRYVFGKTVYQQNDDQGLNTAELPTVKSEVKPSGESDHIFVAGNHIAGQIGIPLDIGVQRVLQPRPVAVGVSSMWVVRTNPWLESARCAGSPWTFGSTSAIFASTFAQVILQRRALVLALGYNVPADDGVVLDAAAAFAQLAGAPRCGVPRRRR